MAPLKVDPRELIRQQRRTYPWLGGHGSIEGLDTDNTLIENDRCIHGWEVMAPLKVLDIRHDDQIVTSIHGWEVMAPLKDIPFSLHVAWHPSIHGWEVMAPLKASPTPTTQKHSRSVSMAERSWLH